MALLLPQILKRRTRWWSSRGGRGRRTERAGKVFYTPISFHFFLINLYFKGGFRLLAKDRRRCGNNHRIDIVIAVWSGQEEKKHQEWHDDFSYELQTVERGFNILYNRCNRLFSTSWFHETEDCSIKKLAEYCERIHQNMFI